MGTITITIISGRPHPFQEHNLLGTAWRRRPQCLGDGRPSPPHRSQDPAPPLRAEAPQYDEAVIGFDRKDKGRQQYRRKKNRANNPFYLVFSVSSASLDRKSVV